MTCTHPLDHESIKACALKFGKCWQNPPRTEKTKHLIHNKPNGTPARDGFNYGISK
jgi:hypothetical protein